MDVKAKGITMPDGNTHIFIPPSPTQTERGGVIAKKKTTETVEVAVGEDDKLYVPGTDNTLTDETKAANAKATGDKISELKNDIRLLIEGLTTRLNVLADSDDTALDQMSEIVAYIKSNKSLIDAITTSKVSVSDIIDNLTTNVANKPLSAAQGVALKALIDGILPSVTTSDNGKFLRVSDGAWSAVALTDVSEVGA